MTGMKFSAVDSGYGSLRVLTDLDLVFEQGFSVVLGPNGCGKTTMFRTGCGILEPDSGKVTINGRDPYSDPDAKQLVSYLPHRPVLNDGLTVEENLHFWGRIQGMKKEERERRIEDVADQFEFSDLLDRQANELSRGQSQRASIGQALLSDPEILFLDEATTGLDPMIARDIRSYLEQLGNERTVIYSTHDLNEADSLADRLVMLQDGSVIFDGMMDDVREDVLEQPRIGFDTSSKEKAREVLRSAGYEPTVEKNYVVIDKRPDDEVSNFVSELSDNGINVREVKMMENTVRTVYERMEAKNE
jgi:ABC-type multidrug transport system ATPase subunit